MILAEGARVESAAEAASSVQTRGWARLAVDPDLGDWAAAARAIAEAFVARGPGDLRHGGSWAPGVDALGADASGGAPRRGLPALRGRAVEAARRLIGVPIAWDRGQISVCFPGFPDRGAALGDAAARYRRDRFGAHLDGLLPVGSEKRRVYGERHAFLLGIALTENPETASPLVVWDRSHRTLGAALRRALAGVPPERWAERDVTAAYRTARRRVFEAAPPLALPLRAGEAVLLHRFALHGVAPWDAGDDDPPRAIAYFRPPPPTRLGAAWALSAL